MGIVLERGTDHPYYFMNGLDERFYREAIVAADEATSYKPANYERTLSYQRGTWDGTIHLLRRARNGTYFFPSGLLKTVCEVLDGFGVEYTVVDRTQHVKDGISLEWVTDKKLRDYQHTSVENAIDEMLTGSGGSIICLPTGAGKSFIMCRIIYELRQKTIIIVHTKDLLNQWKKVIHEMFGFYPAIIGDSVKDPPGKITVAMVQTLYSMLKKDPSSFPGKEFNLSCFDEVHRVCSNTAYAVSMAMSAKYRLGASATPTREDNTQLRIIAATGSPVDVPSTEEFIDKKILAIPEFRFYRLPHPRVYGNKWPEVRMSGIVLNDARNEAICGAVEHLISTGHSVYVSVDILTHGERLVGMIRGACPESNAVFLQGSDNTKRREAVFSKFKSGEIKALVSTLLREGVDIPEISAYVNAAGGKSEVSQIQRVGRALRQNPAGDKTSVIVDFIDGGHRWLGRHWDQRWQTYRKYYGDYCPFPR